MKILATGNAVFGIFLAVGRDTWAGGERCNFKRRNGMETISRPICGSAQSMGPAQDQLRCEPGTMLGLVIHCNPRSWVIFLTRTFGLRLRCEMGMEGAGCWLGWRYPRMQMGEAVLDRKKTSDTRNLFIALRITDQVQVVGASGLGISASSLICERLPSLSFWKKLCGY